jgi:hypothetical protein
MPEPSTRSEYAMSKTGGMPERKEIVCVDLPYEIRMLRAIYQRLQCGFDLQTTANLFIEGFALHARNLIDFFWDNKPLKSKNAVARHFTDKCYSPFNGVDPKTNGVYGKINKQIAHITYDRTDIDQNKLGIQDRKTLFEMIEGEIENFANHVRAPYKELWQKTTHPPTVVPALGSDRFVYLTGQSGPLRATVTTVGTTSVSFSADPAADGGSKSKS